MRAARHAGGALTGCVRRDAAVAVAAAAVARGSACPTPSKAAEDQKAGGATSLAADAAGIGTTCRAHASHPERSDRRRDLLV